MRVKLLISILCTVLAAYASTCQAQNMQNSEQQGMTPDMPPQAPQTQGAQTQDTQLQGVQPQGMQPPGTQPPQGMVPQGQSTPIGAVITDQGGNLKMGSPAPENLA